MVGLTPRSSGRAESGRGSAIAFGPARRSTPALGGSLEPSLEWHRAGLVVELCNQIELYMKAIIEAYVRPRADRGSFFRAYVLNNAIVPFAAKMKLVLAINREANLVQLDTIALHKVMNLRNAFAHNDLVSGIRVEEPTSIDDPLQESVVLESIRGDGAMDTVTREAAFEQFRDAHERAEKCLKEMLGKLSSRGDR